MDALLANKHAVITGCNRGIGKAIVNVFARNGATIWACARKYDEQYEQYLRTLAETTNTIIHPVYFDLTDMAQVKQGLGAIFADKPAIDVLVNNAGIIHTALFQMTSSAKFKEIFEVNVNSQFVLTQHIVKSMIRHQAGSIINISSSTAIDCNEGRAAYAASKAAVIAWTKVVARELGKHNIRANAIAPGLTETDMMMGSTPVDAMNETLSQTCLKRVGRPEEIANVALFLASPLSSYVTGQAIRVDGGM